MSVSDNDTKRRIIDSAIELFKKNGYPNVTINDICKESGINKNTFYYYFTSKDLLLEDFFAIISDYSSDDLSLVMEADAYIDQLWLMLKIKLDYIQLAEYEIIKQLIIINLNRDIGSFNASEKQKNVFRMFTSLIKRCQAAGQINNKSLPESLSFLLYQSIPGVMLTWCLTKGKYPLERHMRCNFETILDVSSEYRSKEIPDFNQWMCRA